MVRPGTGPLVALAVVLIAKLSLQAYVEENQPNEANQDSRIIDLEGTNSEPRKASLGDFPWQVLVHTKKPEEDVLKTFLSGGSIIHKQWIMSAAHNFAKMNFDENGKPNGFTMIAKSIKLYAGLVSRNNVNEEDVQKCEYDENEVSAALFIHPQFNQVAKYNNDIALLKLKTPFNLDVPNVDLIHRATSSDNKPGKMLTASGWGLRSKDATVYPIELRFVTEMKLLSLAVCSQNIGTTGDITDKMICQITNKKATFTGDSGGPVITGRGELNGPPYVQIGIASWDYSNTQVQYASVFTNVAEYETWINGKIAGNTISACNSRNSDGFCQNGNGPSCNSVGGKCKKARKRCKGKIDETFECADERKFCCIDGCSEENGFFRLPHPSNQCFKFYDQGGTWYDANNTCHSSGLVLARPLEMTVLRSYLTLRYGSEKWAWLDGMGNGTCIEWNRGEYGCISPDIPIWYPGKPGEYVQPTNCLLLLSNAGNWGDYPDKPLWSENCSKDGRYPLCELVMQ